MPKSLPFPLPIALALCLLTQGCIASTAVDIVTAPVKVASKAVDLATTSQSEADEKRGRDMRKREEQLGKLERQWHTADKRCREGRQTSCQERDALYAEITALRPTLPQSYSN